MNEFINNSGLTVNTYDPSKSSTQWPVVIDGKKFRKFKIGYADGFTADGLLWTDTLTFGGLTVPNQTFGLINATKNMNEDPLIDGMFGLGLYKGANSEAPPPHINLAQLGLLSQPIFSIYLDL